MFMPSVELCRMTIIELFEATGIAALSVQDPTLPLGIVLVLTVRAESAAIDQEVDIDERLDA